MSNQQWNQPEWTPRNPDGTAPEGQQPQEWGQQPPQPAQQQWGQPQDWTQQGQTPANEWGQPQQQPSAQDWHQAQPQQSAGEWHQAQPQPSAQDWTQPQPSAQDWTQGQASAPEWNQQQQDWNQQQGWGQQDWNQQQWQGQQGYSPVPGGYAGTPQWAPAPPKKPSPFDFSFKQPALPGAAGSIFLIGTIGIGVWWLFNLIESFSYLFDYPLGFFGQLFGNAGLALFAIMVLRVLIELGVAAFGVLNKPEAALEDAPAAVDEPPAPTVEA